MRRGGALVFSLFALLSCEGTTGPLIEQADENAPPQAAGGSGGADEDGEPAPPISGLGPPVGASFQVQLAGDLDTSVDAELYVVDLEKSEEEFAALAAASRYIACYFSAGSHEPWRDDADAFPAASIGEPLSSYPNERWLDVSSDAVVQLMEARIDLAKERGCSAIYPSLVRPGADETGFGLPAADYSAFSMRLAEAAHERGLGALYPGAALPSGEEDAYDAAIVYGCHDAGTCDTWASYSTGGRGLFFVAYGDADAPEDSCPSPGSLAAPTIVKEQNLSAFRFECP